MMRKKTTFLERVEQPGLRLSLCRNLLDYIQARAKRDMSANAATEAEKQEAAHHFEALCHKNADHLRHILKIYGWPGVSMVGREAAHAACFLAVLCDGDLPLQKRSLELMIEAGAKEVPPQMVARLTDRILVAEGKPQIYGTQFRTDANGVYGPAPIADEANVDQRRADMGLEPLAKRIEDTLAFIAGWSGGTSGTRSEE